LLADGSMIFSGGGSLQQLINRRILSIQQRRHA
jgi:hypothetical protein